MKKRFKIIISIFLALCLVAFVCGMVDINRASSNKEPIFSVNQSGGSAILYIGPGYVIDGALDDNPGGLEYSKIHTWIWFLVHNM